MKPFKACTCHSRKPDGGQGPLLGASCPRLWITTADGKSRLNPNHGRWYVRYELPAKPDGTRQRRRIGPYDTAKEAADDVARKLGVARDYGHPQDRNRTVGQHLAWCVEVLWPSQGWQPRSLQDAKIAVDLYWLPAFGHLPLGDLTKDHVLAAVAAIRKINRDESDPDDLLDRLIKARAVKHGKRLSVRPITDIRIDRIVATLRSALNTDEARQFLPRNPAARLRERKAGRGRDEGKPLMWTAPRVASWRRTGKIPGAVTIWTAAMAGEFLAHVRDDRLYALFVLAINTGARRGELIALEWSEVDLDQRTVEILQGKSENAARVIGIDQHTAAVLKEWHRQQTAERLAWGPAYVVSDAVFTREDGTPLEGPHVSYRFQRLASEAGLPPTRFHDLRHGVACWLLAANVSPKIIQERLGHSSVSFTLDKYAAFLPDQDREAADALGALISQQAR